MSAPCFWKRVVYDRIRQNKVVQPSEIPSLKRPVTTDVSFPVAQWEVWEERAWSRLVEAMKLKRVSYRALSQELEKLGVFETPAQLNRKVNRRKFSAAFFLACMQALERIEP